MTDTLDFKAIDKLTRDVRAAARVLSDAEARYLVDLYYQMQEYRIRASNQTRAAVARNEPQLLIDHVTKQFTGLESQMKIALGLYAQAHVMGDWLFEIRGIGPILGAGMLAHIDVTKTKHASSLWRYAGYDPTCKWEKGKKRPYNAQLKQLMWKVGESFVKCGGQYRVIYDKRKAHEQARNEAGDFATQAATHQTRLKKWAERTGTELLEMPSGQLPPKLIHSRAKWFVCRVFMEHFWVEYRKRLGLPYSDPYVIVNNPDHTHYLAHIPNEKSAARAAGDTTSDEE